MTNNNYTALLANYVMTFDKIQIPSLIVSQVKKAILDYFCAAITGSRTEVSNKLYSYLQESSSSGASNAIGYKDGLSIESAAFINGTSAHCYDFDDGHTGGSFHPGAVVIPAVLGCAQQLNSSSEKVIRSIIVGYEISIRISSAMHPSSRKKGFHNTSVAGIFGATAAVSYLNGMKVEDIQQSLGIAGSFASGLFAFLGSGSEIKRLHPGKAARDAITAVNLVKAGITGPDNVLENKNGVFHAFADNDISIENLMNDLGTTFLIEKIYFKPYPCCRHLHSTIDAIYKVKEKQSINLSKITEVNIGVNSMAYLHSHKKCDTLLDAQMSLPYAASAAIVMDSLNVDSFDPEKTPGEVWEVIEKVNVYIDDQAERGYPQKRLANVEIVMEDGNKMSKVVEIPLGEPTNPLSDEQLEGKFLDNCSPILGKEIAEQFVINLRNWSGNSVDSMFLYEV